MTEEAPLPSERRARLVARVRETGSARVSDLSRVLGVTPVTVRRDLALLVADGTLEKVHGGARIPAREAGPGAGGTGVTGAGFADAGVASARPADADLGGAGMGGAGMGGAGMAGTGAAGRAAAGAGLAGTGSASTGAADTGSAGTRSAGLSTGATTGIGMPRTRPADTGQLTIGMVVPSLDYYWPEVIRGARSAAHGAARLILRGASYDVDQVRRQVTALIGDDGGHGVDGLLVAPPVDGPDAAELGEWLAGLNLPVVLMERRLSAGPYREPLESVATDHALGSGMAARHIAERGHRRVGLVTSRTSPTSAAVRRGFLTVADELGLDVVLDLETVPLSDAGWAGEAAAVLDKWAEAGATALLVHSDREAISLVEQAQERGVRVPADLAVVAYDDEVAGLADPPLTAVRPPKAAIGAGAVELLTRRLGAGSGENHGNGADDAPHGRPVHRVELNAHLVVRASSGARA